MAATLAACLRSGSMARISGISSPEHEQHQHHGGQRENHQRRVIDDVIPYPELTLDVEVTVRCEDRRRRLLRFTTGSAARFSPTWLRMCREAAGGAVQGLRFVDVFAPPVNARAACA